MHNFTDLSSKNYTTITKWIWNFGDEGSPNNIIVTTSSEAVSYTYTKAGIYTVTLKVEDAQGLFDETSTEVFIGDIMIDIKAIQTTFNNKDSLSVNVSANLTLQFGATIDSILWEFGDGKTANALDSTNIYTKSGNKTVKLIVTDSKGYKYTKEHQINVYFVIPDFTLTSNGLYVTFQNTTQVDGIEILKYELDFNNTGTVLTPVSATGTVSYMYTSGTHTAKLIVTDASGKEHTFERQFDINNIGLKSVKADFIAQATSTKNTYLFTDKSYQNFTTITKWKWDFGDGTSSDKNSNTSVSRTYSKGPGEYNITLQVEDINGLSDKKTAKIFVGGIDVSFDANNTDFLTVEVKNTSNTPYGAVIKELRWDFDNDGTVDYVSTNPSEVKKHTYTTAGKKNIKLIVIDENNWMYSLIKEINLAYVKADFSIELNGSEVIFKDTSLAHGTISTDEREWDFDNDGEVDDNKSEVKYFYRNDGLYTAKLTIKRNRTEYTVTKPITVKTNNIIFTGNNSNACVFLIKPSGDIFRWGYVVDCSGYSCSMKTFDKPTELTAFKDAGIKIQSFHIRRGGENIFVIDDSNTLYVWGKRESSGTGTGFNDLYIPTKVKFPIAETKVKSIFFSYTVVFAITMDGNLYSWGWNKNGQLGIGDITYTNTNTPTQVNFPIAGTKVKSIFTDNNSVVYNSVYAISDNGTLYSWGLNDYGQLGIGNTIDINIPTPVKFPVAGTKVKSVNANSKSTFAITVNGDLYAWGNNNDKEPLLGVGRTGTKVKTPIQVKFPAIGTKVESVISSARIGSSFAIAENGFLYGWGSNKYYQLGYNGVDILYEPPIMMILYNRIVESIYIDESGFNVFAFPKHKYDIFSDNFFGWGYSACDYRDKNSISHYGYRTLSFQEYGNSLCARFFGITSEGELNVWGTNTNNYLSLENQSINSSGFQILVDEQPMNALKGIKIKYVVPPRHDLDYFIAVARDDTIYVWGDNSDGILGLGKDFKADTCDYDGTKVNCVKTPTELVIPPAK